MTTVLVATGEGDKPFWNAARRILAVRCGAVLVGGGELRTSSVPPDLIVCDAAAVQRSTGTNIIHIYRDADTVSCLGTVPNTGVVVVDSSDERLLLAAGRTELPAITCGLSPRDTLTLSSIDVDSAVINLQRSVTCFDGTVAEPQEIPVRLGAPIEKNALLLVAGILILCGHMTKLSEDVL